MAEELQWSPERKNEEMKEARHFIDSMGLQVERYVLILFALFALFPNLFVLSSLICSGPMRSRLDVLDLVMYRRLFTKSAFPSHCYFSSPTHRQYG